MKKLLSVLLILCLMLSALALVACNDEQPETPDAPVVKTTAEKFNEAIRATYAQDSYAATYDMSISMEMMGMTVDVPTTMELKVKNAASDNPVASIDMTMEMFGMGIDVPMYMENGWLYTYAMGETYKMRVTEEVDYTQSVNDMLQELPENYLNDAQLTVNPDGSETIVLVMPGSEFADIFANTIADAAASAADTFDGLDISNTGVEITIKGGVISVYSMRFDMKMEVEGVETTVSTTCDMTFTAFGDDVVVTPPEGYLDFPEESDSIRD